MELFAFLNNNLIGRNEAKISIHDRGFKFGDGLFTTIALIKGVPLFWDLHLNRIKLGLAALKIDAKINDLHDKIKLLVEKNLNYDGIVRIIITRGEGSRGYTPTNQSEANILIEMENNPPAIINIIEDDRFLNKPINLHVSEWRKIPPECLPTEFKIMQGINPTLARIDAIGGKYDDALMLSYDGFVSEVAASNIFWFDKTELCTPPLKTGCLNGVMRQKIMQITNVKEKLILHSELYKKPCFATNSLNGLTPIKTINGNELPNCESYIQKLQSELRQLISVEIMEYI
jgi:branched-subunit amino acid aminotransferase/4-amino-4-deoxychorismate lyase